MQFHKNLYKQNGKPHLCNILCPGLMEQTCAAHILPCNAVSSEIHGPCLTIHSGMKPFFKVRCGAKCASKFCPFSPRNLTGEKNSKIRISYVFSNFEQVVECSKTVHILKIFKKVLRQSTSNSPGVLLFLCWIPQNKMSMSAAA